MNLMLSESISYYKREGFMSIVKVLKKKKNDEGAANCNNRYHIFKVLQNGSGY